MNIFLSIMHRVLSVVLKNMVNGVERKGKLSKIENPTSSGSTTTSTTLLSLTLITIFMSKGNFFQFHFYFRFYSLPAVAFTTVGLENSK
jgi:hypothetical protein